LATTKTGPGLGVDSSGDPAIDPTANVLQLVQAEGRRLDDLRMAEVRRSDDLRQAETNRVNEQALLTATYEERLRQAEAKRIDAIRAVDVNAVAVASERATQQVNVLASQVSQSAEMARALVSSTAASLSTQIQTLTTQLTDRILALEKSQYELKGRSGYSDPAEAAQTDATAAALSRLAQEIQEERLSRAGSQGRSEGLGMGWKLLIGGVGLLAALVALSQSGLFNRVTP
jgi:hypothetical protein